MSEAVPLMYDPPGGWKWGFPKEYKPLPGESLVDTLKRDGYKGDLQLAEQYTRWWAATPQECDNGD